MTDPEIRGIYNSLEKKDMSFEAFHREVKELTDPARMRADAEKLIAGRTEKRRIDQAVSGGGIINV